MRESDDMPTLKQFQDADMCADDPQFRENFSTQPDKPLEASVLRGRAVQGEPYQRPYMEQPEKGKPIIKTPEVSTMIDTSEVIAMVRKLSMGGNFVRADTLIKALS